MTPPLDQHQIEIERNRAACGPAALLSEEWDVRERQLRGNFPQAFTHLGLISAAFSINRKLDDSGWVG